MSAVPSIHHTVLVAEDIDASVAFYRDGVGLSVLQDRTVEGDWPTLFAAPSRTLRAVFLGDPDVADDHSGVLELNQLGDVGRAEIPATPSPGLFMISFFVDVEPVLKRLASLGLGGVPRRVQQATPNGPITIVTVQDPDGGVVLLTPGAITRRSERPPYHLRRPVCEMSGAHLVDQALRVGLDPALDGLARLHSEDLDPRRGDEPAA